MQEISTVPLVSLTWHLELVAQVHIDVVKGPIHFLLVYNPHKKD